MDQNQEEDEVEIVPTTEDNGEDKSNRLTDWEKEPTVRDLKQDFTDSASDRDSHITDVDTWLDNLNVKGSAVIEKVDGKSAVVPKLIRKQAEWRYASLSEPFLSTDDLFNTFPITYEDKKGAIQNGLVLNNQFNTKIRKVKFIDEYVRTVVDEGTAVVRVGWEFQEEEQDVEVPRMSEVPIDDPYLAQGLIDQGLPTIVPIQVGTEIVKKMVTTKNEPTLDVCDYRNTTIDPSCEGNIDKANFVIYSFQTSISALKKDGKYHNLDKIIVENASPLTDTDHSSKDDSAFNFKDKERKLFIAYEYWGFRDIDGSGILTSIVATYVGEVMIRLEKNPFPDQKLPFVTVQYLPVRKSIYGEPDGALLEDNQKIVGAVTRGMIDIMARSANGQVGSRKDALDTTNKRRFDKGEDYEINSGVDASQAFYMHKYPEIPKSAEVMLNMQNADAESMSGVKAFNNGISGQALGDTATGIRSALDATSKRELGILRRLAEGVTEIGRKIVSMNAEFLEEEEVVRITNEEFVTVRRDDLEGNFDLGLSISTAEADNEKASNLSFMLQTLGNNVDPGITNIVLGDIATLHKMPELAKRLSEYKPEPDPMAVEKAQLENMLLKAQIFNEEAKGKENTVDIDLKRAKTETEKGKARSLHSDSDKKDLDYLEQGSGLTRQHETDMKDHDRNTQLDLKAADSMLSNNDGQTGNKLTPIPNF